MANERDSGDLIRQLASSFGMAETLESKRSGSRYDEATGTLYCDGIAVSKTSLESALAFFEKQRDYYRAQAARDSTFRDQFINFSVAYNAIWLMMAGVNNNDK